MDLPSHLLKLPAHWPFPRGDLYHWIPVLDRFDTILQHFCEEYGLNKGPQTKPFGIDFLQKNVSGDDPLKLSDHGFSDEADRELVESILSFTRLLLEKCGNRSLYSSSSNLNDLLNTTSLTLLEATLRLSLHLAQRYHASRTRLGSMSQNAGLLASHYNINLERVNKIASPFVRDFGFMSQAAISSKSRDEPRTSAQEKHKVDPADIVTMIKRNGKEEMDWAQNLGVSLRYYQTSEGAQVTSAREQSNAPEMPPGPATVRHSNTSALSSTTRNNRHLSSSEIAHPSDGSNNTRTQDHSSAHSKLLQLCGDVIATTPLTDILKCHMPNLPHDVRYELLARLRVSHAIGSSAESRHKAVITRILAVANLAYVYPESAFQQKIAQVDSEEPRRFQLPYQLAELLQPPDTGESVVPRPLQTVALSALEALTRQKSKSADVGSALSVGVNHGILSYILRKAVKEINDSEGKISQEDYDWRNALFALIMSLPNSSPRAGESLISAGLLDSLMEILKARNTKSERHFQDVLTFLDVYVYNIRSAFQALINASGLNIIADGITYYAAHAFTSVENGNGIPEAYMTRLTDFKIPFYSQQNLRWLFKFTNHMLSHGSGNFDRLLRNLISSPQLLNSLRKIIENAQVFGSSVWTGAVNIMVNLIHNEPTSYAIFAEAGLSKTFLDSISVSAGEAVIKPVSDTSDDNKKQDESKNQDQKPTTDTLKSINVQGILPSAEVITVIPQVFGAICLIESGMNLFLTSDALQTFFGIFLSKDHIKILDSEHDVAANLGNAFDELVRHHPQLKDPVLDAVQNMILRVALFCFDEARMHGSGTKLWLEADNGRIFVAGGFDSLKGEEGPLHRRARFAKQMSDPNSERHAADKTNERVSPIAWKDELRYDLDEKSDALQYINVICKFLKGFLGNPSLCGSFIERGSFEYILDLATLPFWPANIHGDDSDAGDLMARLVQILVEQKPHLVLPQLMNRLCSSLNGLDVLVGFSGEATYLSQFTDGLVPVSQVDNPPQPLSKGTHVAKALVSTTMMCTALGISFQEPIFQPRSSSSLFSQINLADVYVEAIQKLGVLYQVLIKEEFELQQLTSSTPKGKLRLMDPAEAGGDRIDVLNILNATNLEFTEDGESSETPSITPAATQKNDANTNESNETARYLNKKIIGYILAQATNSIASFFQGIGRTLLLKRTVDIYQKQNASLVAHQLARSFIDMLHLAKSTGDRGTYSKYASWVVVLSSITGSMTDNCTYD